METIIVTTNQRSLIYLGSCLTLLGFSRVHDDAKHCSWMLRLFSMIKTYQSRNFLWVYSSICKGWEPGTPVVVWRLRSSPPSAGGLDSTSDQGPSSHMPQRKIPPAAAKIQCNQISNFFKRLRNENQECISSKDNQVPWYLRRTLTLSVNDEWFYLLHRVGSPLSKWRFR